MDGRHVVAVVLVGLAFCQTASLAGPDVPKLSVRIRVVLTPPPDLPELQAGYKIV
jgi:hypothetical protein